VVSKRTQSLLALVSKLNYLTTKTLLKTRKKLPRILTELGHLGVKQNVVFFDLSTQLISQNPQSNADILSMLKRFALEQDASVVLVFSQENHQVSDYLFNYQQQFTGVMKLTGGGYPSTLSYSHWFAGKGMQPYIQLPVKFVNGQLSIIAKDEFTADVQSSDELVVFIDHHHAMLEGVVNKNWVKANTAEEMDNLVAKNRMATVLCHATLSEPIYDLAQRIYRWRQIAGEELKVILIEGDVYLRLSEQKILKSLGANIVLPKHMNMTTLNNIITSIQQLRYHGDLTADFSTILKPDAVPKHIGYLEPVSFLSAGQKLIRTSGQYGIESALIYLEVPTGIPVLETVRHSQFNRFGDLFTIVDNQVVIYLYGCRDENIEETLTAILGASPLLIFKSLRKFSNLDNIQMQMLELQDYIENITVADHSEEIKRFIEEKALKEQQTVQEASQVQQNIAKPHQLKVFPE